MALPSFVARDYSGGVPEGVQLTAQIGSGDLSFTIATTTGWTNAAGQPLGTVGPFTVIIDQGTASAEKILCSSVNLTSGLVTVYNSGGTNGRGYDQTTAQAHVPGGSPIGVVPCWSAVEAKEANAAAVFGPGGGGSVIGLTGNPSARIYVGAGQSIPSATQTTVLDYTVDYLVGGFTYGSGLLTIPVTGKYHVSAELQLTWTAAASNAQLYVLVGGSVVRETITNITTTASVAYSLLPITSDMNLTAGQTVAMAVYQNSANSTALTVGSYASWLDLHLVSA
jgi:hypothetical protein